MEGATEQHRPNFSLLHHYVIGAFMGLETHHCKEHFSAKIAHRRAIFLVSLSPCGIRKYFATFFTIPSTFRWRLLFTMLHMTFVIFRSTGPAVFLSTNSTLPVAFHVIEDLREVLKIKKKRKSRENGLGKLS